MTASQAEKAERFRALHAGPGIFVIPNPWDAGSARILAGLGFQALATTSAGAAFTLGRLDGALGREACLANAKAIVEATDLPVSADLENGFDHTPAGAAETIRLAAATGLVGGSIEDSSGEAASPIYDLSHAVERVKAAVAAARSLPFPFTLTARAENFLHGRDDLEDTIARLQAFEAAGADVLYAPGLPGLDAVRTVCAAVTKPVNVLLGIKGMRVSVADLEAAGVRRVSVGSLLARTALGAFIAASRELQDQGTFSVPSNRLAVEESKAWFSGIRP